MTEIRETNVNLGCDVTPMTVGELERLARDCGYTPEEMMTFLQGVVEGPPSENDQCLATPSGVMSPDAGPVNSDLAEMAESCGCTPAEMQAFLVAHGEPGVPPPGSSPSAIAEFPGNQEVPGTGIVGPGRQACLVTAIRELLVRAAHSIPPANRRTFLAEVIGDDWNQMLDLPVHGQRILDRLGEFGFGAMVVWMQNSIAGVAARFPRPPCFKNRAFDPEDDRNKHVVAVRYSADDMRGTNGHFSRMTDEELVEIDVEPEVLCFLGEE